MVPPRALIVNYLSTHFGADTEDFAGLPPVPRRALSARGEPFPASRPPTDVGLTRVVLTLHL